MNARHCLGFLVFCLLGLFTGAASAYTCPDEKVNIVVATGLPEVDHQDSAYKEWGKEVGFVVHHVPSAEHNRTNLLNWMQCKKLSFFLNISHGATDTSITTAANEFLTGEDIRKNVNFRGRTVFFSHSCDSASSTGPGSLARGLKDANARGFIGTNRAVYCGAPDIGSTTCTVYAVLLHNYTFDKAVTACIAKYKMDSFLVVNKYTTEKELDLITPAQLQSIVLEEEL